MSVMASGPMSLNNLPEEILLIILSHVGPEDIFRNIAKVCKRWNALAKERILWKKVSYSCGPSSHFSRIAKVLTNAPALHSLIIHLREDAIDILEFLNHIHRDLRKLILKRCYLGEDRTGLLANIVDLCPDLEVLSLESCYPRTSDGYCLIPRLKKLSELNLSYCEALSGKTVRLIADSCQHLKKMSLRCVRQIDNDDVIHIVKKLGKQLTTLDLLGERLTDVAYSYLNNCTRLRELEVSCCKNMTDRGLLEGIGSLQELTFLRLTKGHNLTAQALSTFLHRPSMKSIVSLILSECLNLDDEGLKGIAKRCIHVKELEITWCCNVTDAGISMVISHCNQLHILRLMFLPSITGKGYLKLVPSHLPLLRELWLWSCRNVRNKYIEELVATEPELEIYK